MMRKFNRVLITGGAGYVGSQLVPKLLEAGYKVRVLDLYLYGDDVLESVKNNPNLEQVKGDMRNEGTLQEVIPGCDAVIHLACISNDPSFELDPKLGKSINYDCFPAVVRLSKQNGVKRFIYASSSSVYGVKEVPNVTEDLPLEPLTDYSKYKALCEDILLKERAAGFVTFILRPATVCGFSPRLRLDLTVNILTASALTNGKIKVFGGSQMRPNIHIDDMCDVYLKSLEWKDEQIDGKIFNAGYENYPLKDIAQMVRGIVGQHVEIIVEPTSDLRSYHISSDKIKRELGYTPKKTIEDAVKDLVNAFNENRITDPINNTAYYNIKTMQQHKLT